ncbi:nuclear cap-binding protein subunit 1-like [Dendronephthya gigantea]|uniref:nuclear cap-binding protein subunit 1-like n=1 Tax=Dendronephthya gigantea TaxID=151771 RepID=UPI00106B5EF9|nr:nuclear cap-binding protein subunit 1-like [Dendronephthya gigantea]
MYGKRRYEDRDRDDGRKRRRKVDLNDIEDKLESLITRVGEKSSASLENNLQQLANVLEADLPNYKERILKIICTCASNHPDKISVYSTLVGLLNVKDYKCGEEFLDLMVDDLTSVLKSGSFERAQLMIRFIADLVNTKVVVPSSLMNMFESFIAVTLENDNMQVRSDWFVHTVLLSFPWAGKQLWETRESDCERLFNTIEIYLNNRRKTHVNGLRVWSSDHPHLQEEYLDCLWAQIQKLKNDNWVEHHIRRPYLAFAETFSEALQHPLPKIPILPREEDVQYPVPQVVFRMFDYTDVPEGPTMPGAHSIERFLVEESLNRIMNAHYKNRKECAAQLMKLPDHEKIPFEYCVIEVIFGNLFNLPVPRHLEIFYGSLLVELCKTHQASVPGVLAQATELLYERIDTMNTTCLHRFINWLSYHFSQFQYKWTWNDRITLIEEPANSPHRRFVCEVLEKCLRSSYYEFILEVVPEQLHELMPQKPDYSYRYEDNSESTPGHEHAKTLVDSIKANKPMDELLALVKKIPATSGDEEDMDYNQETAGATSLKVDVCLQVLLRAGAKSISHTFKALDKFEKILRSVVTNEQQEMHCLRVLQSFWRLHTQMIDIVTDKLIRMDIIHSNSFVNWLFSKEMVEDFHRSYVWDILHSVLKKITKQTEKAKEEMEREKSKLERMEEKRKKQNEEQGSGEASIEEIEIKRVEVEGFTDKLGEMQRQEKEVFIVIFQRFVMMLNQHIAKSEEQQQEIKSPSFLAVSDRLREIFYTYHSEIKPYISILDSLLFTSDVDPHILSIFNQYKALST